MGIVVVARTSRLPFKKAGAYGVLGKELVAVHVDTSQRVLFNNDMM